MKFKRMWIFLSLVTLLCGCGNTNKEKEPDPVTPIEDKEEIPDKSDVEFLETLSIPSSLTQVCEHQGTVEVFNYKTKLYSLDGSSSGEVDKSADVYLPYGYDASKQYNVLYLMHGGGETYTYWLTENKKTVNLLDNMFDRMLANPCIVVAPTFYTGSGSGSMSTELTDIFRYEFKNDLVPQLEKHYATYVGEDNSLENLIKTRSHRGFAGLSMGSMTSIRSILIGCLDITAYITSMSGGYDADDKKTSVGFELIEETLTETYKDYPVYYWLNINGTNDIALTPHQHLNEMVIRLLDDYLEVKKNYYWILLQGGMHSYDSWIVGLYNSLMVFF